MRETRPQYGPLRFDPTTREGRELAELFRDCKRIEERTGGDWNGGDVVEVLTLMFQDLGLDVDGPMEQLEVDTIRIR